MELTDLLTFAAVAKCGGVTRAANELGTVQSNVTSRIRNLENRIGKPLFDRHSRGMTITAAGRRLLPYAERLTVLSEEAINAARDEGEPKGPLAIGSMETTAAVRLPPLLARFHRKCSKVQVSLRTAPTEILVKAVLDRSLDGAFVAGPIDHPGLKVSRSSRKSWLSSPRANGRACPRFVRRHTRAAPVSWSFEQAVHIVHASRPS